MSPGVTAPRPPGTHPPYHPSNLTSGKVELSEVRRLGSRPGVSHHVGRVVRGAVGGGLLTRSFFIWVHGLRRACRAQRQPTRHPAPYLSNPTGPSHPSTTTNSATSWYNRSSRVQSTSVPVRTSRTPSRTQSLCAELRDPMGIGRGGGVGPRLSSRRASAHAADQRREVRHDVFDGVSSFRTKRRRGVLLWVPQGDDAVLTIERSSSRDLGTH